VNAPTDWTSAIAILVGGLVLGSLFVYLFGKRKSIVRDDLARKDLEARRDALIQQLRVLDAGASDERERLESETADVLRKLDHQTPAPAASGAGQPAPRPAPAPSSLSMNPAFKGFLWGALSIAVLAGLGYFVMRQAKPRGEGDSLTGNLPPEAQQQQQQQQQSQQPDPLLEQLLAAVQREPNNLQARNNLAQA